MRAFFMPASGDIKKIRAELKKNLNSGKIGFTLFKLRFKSEKGIN